MASEVVKLRLSVDDVRRWTPASETFSFCSLLAKASLHATQAQERSD